MEILEEVLMSAATILAVIVEIIGIILIAVALIRQVIAIVKTGCNFHELHASTAFNNGMGVALEVLLSAEILKTITVHSMSALIEVVILVLIRLFMAFMVNWETKQKSHH